MSIFNKTFIIVLLGSCISLSASATTYYVDNQLGSDSNAGTSAAAPWKTVAQVNGTWVYPGDNVLFKAGGQWRETLTPNGSGSSAAPVTFGVYGTGNKPELNGAAVVSNWAAETIATPSLTNVWGSGFVSNWAFSELSGSRLDSGPGKDTLTSNNQVGQTTGPRVGAYAATFVRALNQSLTRSDSTLDGQFPGKSVVAQTSMTAGAWLNVSANTGTAAAVWGKGFSWNFVIEGSTIIFRIEDTNKKMYSATANTAYPPGTWIHAVGRWTQGGEVALFINGIKQDMTSSSTSNLRDTGALWFGSVPYADPNYEGSISQPFVFSAALTDPQILQIYSNGLSAGSFTDYYVSMAADPQQVFEDNQRLGVNSVPVITDLIPGSYYFDPSKQLLHIRTLEDGNPSTHLIEASALPQGVSTWGRSYLSFQGLQIDKSQGQGMYLGGGSSNVTMTGLLVTQNAQDGIFFWDASLPSSNISITNSEVSWNQMDGIQHAAPGNNISITNLLVHHNCLNPTGPNYVGGIRIVSNGVDSNRQTNVTVANNTVYNNGIGVGAERGHGIWLDTVGAGSTVTNNTSYNNFKSGVFIEWAGTTGGISIQNNVLYSNQIGIEVSRMSHNVSITGNTAYNNDINISVQGQYGGDPVGMVNITASGNTTYGGQWYEVVIATGAQNDGVNGSGNTYLNNCFGTQHSNFVIWGSTAYSTYASWMSAAGGAVTITSSCSIN